jgi:FkbM family methyltransferase
MPIASQAKQWLRRHAPSVSHRLAEAYRECRRSCWRIQGLRSNSQYGEDVVAIRHFKRRRGGIYVDVGAYDGMQFSNTAMLELQYGWRGVLIEPIKAAYDRMKGCRPASVCINGVVSAEKGPVRFIYSAADGGMLSGTAFDPRHQARLEEESRRQHTKVEVLQVPAFHPNEILRTASALAGPDPGAVSIDFMSIDTEGTELDILRSIDWETFRPKLLCVENHFRERHQADFLAGVGYRPTGTTLGYCNDFYEDSR